MSTPSRRRTATAFASPRQSDGVLPKVTAAASRPFRYSSVSPAGGLRRGWPSLVSSYVHPARFAASAILRRRFGGRDGITDLHTCLVRRRTSRADPTLTGGRRSAASRNPSCDVKPARRVACTSAVVPRRCRAGSASAGLSVALQCVLRAPGALRRPRRPRCRRRRVVSATPGVAGPARTGCPGAPVRRRRAQGTRRAQHGAGPGS